MTDVNPTFPASPATGVARGSDKIWVILSHLSIFIGVGFILLPLIVYLAMKDESPYVAGNSREVLNFHLSVLIYTVLCIPLAFIGVGFVLLGLLWLMTVICSIIGAFKASDNGCYRYPLTLRLVK